MKNTQNHLANGINDLKNVLSQQHSYLLKMLDILNQEHEILGNQNNLNQLEEIVQRKNQQVKKLEEIQPSLNIVEKMMGGVLSKVTFSAFIQRIPTGTTKSDLINLWDNFQKTLTQCDMQNKTNNRILNASAINTKQALNILQGNIDKTTPDIYSKSGFQQDKQTGQSLAIA